jgi:membrane protease YdiL (CAAX protease family)
MFSKDSIHQAILVTSLTFGIGHILNLLNGAELIPTIIQIIYAISTGYMFAIILYKGNSLWPCIITHSIVNTLSIFSIENQVSMYIAPIILTIIPIIYSIYLNKTIKEK